jgi:hypothetical protein
LDQEVELGTGTVVDDLKTRPQGRHVKSFQIILQKEKRFFIRGLSTFPHRVAFIADHEFHRMPDDSTQGEPSLIASRAPFLHISSKGNRPTPSAAAKPTPCARPARGTARRNDDCGSHPGSAPGARVSRVDRICPMPGSPGATIIWLCSRPPAAFVQRFGRRRRVRTSADVYEKRRHSQLTSRDRGCLGHRQLIIRC